VPRRHDRRPFLRRLQSRRRVNREPCRQNVGPTGRTLGRRRGATATRRCRRRRRANQVCWSEWLDHLNRIDHSRTVVEKKARTRNPASCSGLGEARRPEYWRTLEFPATKSSSEEMAPIGGDGGAVSSARRHPRIPWLPIRVGRVAVSCLALVFVLTAMDAAVPEAPTSNLTGPAEHEPITPVPEPPAAEPLKLALGEQLFADPRLSADGSRACISCHDIHTNGATTNPLDKGIDGSELTLNTPTIFNAASSFRLNPSRADRTTQSNSVYGSCPLRRGIARG